ncbi:MAG: lamin tail domain-containing protein [Chloroflexi bacterium]|nr:lamin tail domain-containing protein [Chloroflexota bacterium]
MVTIAFFWLPQPLLARTATDDDPDDAAVTEVAQGDVVINELHYAPDNQTELIEFIELFNRGSAPVDLAEWTLGDAVEYQMPMGVILPANGFLLIAQDPAAIQRKFGVHALGPYAGKLSSEGEALTLRNANAEVVDKVSYQLGFPWPTVNNGADRSIGLINPNLDNALAGHWRSGPPTPGGANATLLANAPPSIELVSHMPQSPAANTMVHITAKVLDPEGVAEVRLLYQVVEPGNYIDLTDAAYRDQWTAVAMVAAGNSLYMADLPAALNQHRRLIRYRVQATDKLDQSVTAPYADDPQPNFAYFVYNGLPAWTGAIAPGRGGSQAQFLTYDFNAMRPVPVYQLLSKRSAVQDAQFIPNSPLAIGYPGHDFLWQGAFIYNGQVYDHIRYRARGATWRYGMGKNMWKFDFNRGHFFQAYDDYGRPFAQKRDNLNLGAVIQQASKLQRGEQGLFESVGFRLFNLAGVPAPTTNFVHFRVIDEANEQGVDQYSGDFWGLYLAVEQYDSRFLDEHHLPDGNLYKIERYDGDLENQSPRGPSDKSDLYGFMNAYNVAPPSPAWWRDNFNLEGYYTFRALIEAIHHYDVGTGKNYYYYFNPETRQWSILPWDIDQTWAKTMAGDGGEPFRDLVAKNPAFKVAYANRVREIRDLLFNPSEINRMIDEHADLIDNPAYGLSLVAADRAMWDYNPIMLSRYVDQAKTGVGHYYERSPNSTFRGMGALMKAWVLSRGDWLDDELAADPAIPNTPQIYYIGATNAPADSLRFQCSTFSDPQGNHTFAAMQWRIAEIIQPGLPTYNPNLPQRYEIQPTWESPLLAFNPVLEPVPGVFQPDHTYRVRVRMLDNTGRWSHWSPPVEVRASAPGAPPATTLKISEIMYHPTNLGPLDDTKLEFIELKNTGSSALDLSNMQITGGISFTFPVGAVIQPQALLVLASYPDGFTQRYGFAPFGEFDHQLSNGGERISIVDAFARPIFSVTYHDSGSTGQTTDGGGHSLVPVDPNGNVSEPDESISWRASTAPHGSPGIDDPLPVMINEVLAHTAPGQVAALELYNPTAYEARIGNWYLTDNPAVPKKFKIPAETRLPANGFIVFDATLFNAQPGARSSFTLPADGGQLYLFSATADGRLTGYRTGVQFGAADAGVSFGHFVNSVGVHEFLAQSTVTLGATNATPRVGPVVISKIMYHPHSGDEFIELQNLSDLPVPLYDPARPFDTWQLSGPIYQFPAGITLPAQGKLLISAISPITVCLTQGVAAGVQIVGPYGLPLSDDGQSLSLAKPARISADQRLAYITVDAVEYDDLPPWPFEPDGTGPGLQRRTPDAYGNDPANWQAGQVDPQPEDAGVASGSATLCAFEVRLTAKGDQREVRWVATPAPDVVGYNIWRSADGQRTTAELLTPIAVPVQNERTGNASYAVMDASGDTATPYMYWLQAVSADGSTVDIAFTTPSQIIKQTYLPLVSR